jgi:hypothetical protein
MPLPGGMVTHIHVHNYLTIEQRGQYPAAMALKLGSIGRDRVIEQAKAEVRRIAQVTDPAVTLLARRQFLSSHVVNHPRLPELAVDDRLYKVKVENNLELARARRAKWHRTEVKFGWCPNKEPRQWDDKVPRIRMGQAAADQQAVTAATTVEFNAAAEGQRQAAQAAADKAQAMKKQAQRKDGQMTKYHKAQWAKKRLTSVLKEACWRVRPRRARPRNVLTSTTNGGRTRVSAGSTHHLVPDMEPGGANAGVDESEKEEEQRVGKGAGPR